MTSDADDGIMWDLAIGPELSQREIATILGISRARVAQIEAEAMRKLRKRLGSEATMSIYEWELLNKREARDRRDRLHVPDGRAGAAGNRGARDRRGKFVAA